MSWLFTRRNYSFNKLESWSDKGNVDKLLKVLEQGNTRSKVFAIKCLESHNYMHVKSALFLALSDSNKFISLKACEVIKSMGANIEEQEVIKTVLDKWNPEEYKPEKFEDSIYFKMEDVKNE